MSASSQTPRERVLTALAHRPPARVPFSWNFGPTPEMADALVRALQPAGLDWHRLRGAVDDIVIVHADPVDLHLQDNTDIWGIVRAPQSYGSGAYNEIVHHPLAEIDDPGALDSYPWPDPAAYDYEALREQALAADPGHAHAWKLAIDSCGNPFEIYCWMTGLETALVNVLLKPDLVRCALDHITSFFAEKMRRSLAQIGDLVDICYFADDLGGQQTLLMSRRVYRDVLQPHHAQLFHLAGELAPHAAVMFHSDGAVFDILPDLIDAGVQVPEAVQTDARGMDPGRLKAAYGDRLCFHGGIPVQSLLPYADEQTVATECRHLIDIFGAGGGYIAAPTHAVQVGTPSANVLAMLRAVLGEEDYAVALHDSRHPSGS